MNAKIAHKYLKENNNVTISIQTLTKVYKELRKIIYKYMKILYKSEPISVKNKNEFFSMDENLINHKNGRQIWLLVVINNQTKDFRIEGTFNRDSSSIA